jgi:peptidoglycan/xylan/chitin deacetylase (PgdA/CDA1 family)
VNPFLVSVPAAVIVTGGVAFYGAAFPRAQLFGRTICRTNGTSKLAITFDDGPNPAITPKLLDLLDRHDAKATFFLIGRFVRECPEIVREIVARGHVVGNHTDTHPNLLWLSRGKIERELFPCSDSIAQVLGKLPNWFRPPFGMRNPWVVSEAEKLGCQTVMWTLIPGDWLEKPSERLIQRMQPIARHAQSISKNGSSPAPRGTGDVLCLHDGSHRVLNADRTRTLKALEYWLPRWRDLGLEFVTMDEAVRTPAA